MTNPAVSVIVTGPPGSGAQALAAHLRHEGRQVTYLATKGRSSLLFYGGPDDYTVQIRLVENQDHQPSPEVSRPPDQACECGDVRTCMKPGYRTAEDQARIAATKPQFHPDGDFVDAARERTHYTIADVAVGADRGPRWPRGYAEAAMATHDEMLRDQNTERQAFERLLADVEDYATRVVLTYLFNRTTVLARRAPRTEGE